MQFPWFMKNKIQEIVTNGVSRVLANEDGRVGPPLLLWFLGVPGSICVALWFFVWRG
jgi:hypothetical protein